MTEFDFDELDKAVSSLMKKTPNLEDTDAVADDAIALSNDSTASVYSASQYPEMDETTKDQSSISSVPNADSKPADPAIVTRSTTPVAGDDIILDDDIALLGAQPAPSARTEALFSPTISSDATKGIVKKRRGTFMDVVHPSSDMRTKQMTAPPRLVPRQEVTIAPIVSQSVSDDSSEELPTSARTPVYRPVAPRTSDDRDLVNVLRDNASYDTDDVAFKNSDPFEYDDIAHDEADSTVLPDAEPKTATNIALQSTESLFLADAKVEKRPLGVQPMIKENEVAEYGQPDQPVDLSMKARLPDELSSKIMAIESEREVTKVEPVSQRIVPRVAEPQSVAVVAPVDSASNSSRPAAVANAQQKPVSAEEDHPGIYDPAYYKQETKPAAKKKSGLWVVFAVIGLIVVGGAGGVLYYFYSTNSF